MARKIIQFHILAVTAIITTFFRGAQVLAVETYSEKISILADIGTQYAAIGKSEQAIKILDQALPLTKEITNQCFKANPLTKVAGGYIQAGQDTKGKKLLEEAIQIAHIQTAKNCSGSATSPDESLLNRAKEYAEAGYYDFALEIITRVNNPIFTPITMAEVAVDYAKAGEVKKATQVVNQAMEIAQRNDYPLYRTMTLVAIAEHLSQPRQTKQVVQQVLKRALESLSAIDEAQSSENTAMKIYQMQRIAKQFAQVGKEEQAIEILDRTLPKIRMLPDKPFPLEKPSRLVKTAIQYAELKQKNKAISTLAEAQTIASISIDKAQSKDSALAKVAEGYAEVGKFDQAQQIARSIKSVNVREEAFRGIVIAYAKAGNSDRAVKLAKSIGNPNSTFIGIIRHYIKIGQNDRALQLVEKWNVKGIKSEIALAYLQAGKPERVLQIVKSISSSPNNSDRMEWIFPDIAREFAKQGQFDQAFQFAQTITDKTDKAHALTGIAQKYVTKKQDNFGFIQKIFSMLTNSFNSLFGSSNKDKASEILDRALQVAQSIQPKN